MAVLQEFKCPCCDGAIEFDSTLQKMKCPYCGSEFEMEALQAYDAELNQQPSENMTWDTAAGSDWQPGETEGFKVSDHVKLLNQYLGKRKIDVVIANDGKIDEDMAKRYESLEQKDPVELDREETEKLVEKVISDDYVTVKNNLLRHKVMKLSMHIFGYLLEK